MPKQKVYNTRAIYFTDKLKCQMAQILNFPCTLVEAPMGYGKTTAVREYLKSTDAHVLWHRVYDGSVSGFWITFSRLFCELDSNRSADLERLGFPSDSVSMQEALKMIEEIELPSETVLVIDDYHLLSATDVGSFIWFLVVNEVDHLHIVLTARFVERLRIDELSLKGYLCHIEKEIFELTPKEIMEYYKLCGISLQAAEADQLYAVTEGWISALYLLMLSAKEAGSFVDTNNIQRLVKDAIYDPFSEEIKDFLLCLCIFDSFTMRQAIHMWGDESADLLLEEVRGKNAFVNFDADTKTYQIHNIFTSFLRGLFEKKDPEYKTKRYDKAGYWYLETGDRLDAMQYFFAAGDFENLLRTVELDKAGSFGNEQKELIIKYFEQCPQEYKRRHPIALLVYAMSLMTFNEMGLFKKTCDELALLIRDGSMDAESINGLTGELELLLSFTRYNDIMGMSEHHKRACALLKKPSAFMDTTGSWTFGSPSVLYMFYRESGKLEQEVRDMKEAMPFYYKLTGGHGTGAEQLMEAERHFNKGDYENAEIAVHQALYLAEGAHQPNMIMCALFLQSRMALLQGDYASVLDLSRKIHEAVEKNKLYTLIHTVDMCRGFIDACLQQRSKIPVWLAEGDFSSSRLFFPARAFSNIIYGRALLLNGDYLKLLGISGQFFGIASVFPNVLPSIYTNIYVGAANERIYRRSEALAAVRQALELAVPDKVHMPFVENCDFIKPLLEALYSEGAYREDIAWILELYSPYLKAVDRINRTYFAEDKPRLSEREEEIARLASEGFSNKQIGEKLFISENTVKKHLKGVFEKLGVSSRSLLMHHFDSIG
ncbi:MAG: LuxR C-terminal-related transcriptional regulator [Clostridiaceae bacterium]